MEQLPDSRLTFEEALRVIGRQLDAEPAYYVRVRQVADGFTVQYRPSLQQSDERIIHFSWTRLKDLSVFNSAGRGLQRKHGRYQGIWAQFPNGHQGFFRTLGSRIDAAHGADLIVDEQEDSVRVSYSMLDASDSRRTFETELKEPEIREMIEQALTARRGQKNATS